jgi:hypothetical protein
MSVASRQHLTARHSMKENRPMKSRLATVVATVLGAGLLMLAVLPIASASAAMPWWQVLTGSRPTHLWEPVDSSETQELTGERLKNPLFGGAVLAAKVEVAGNLVGCLGSGAFPFVTANKLCEEQTGSPASENAAELEAMLEGPYGAGEVKVTGGPAGDAPFVVESPWGMPIELTVLEFFGIPMGVDVGADVTSEGSGRLVLTLTNLGDAAVDGSGTPIRIVDDLPQGVAAHDVEGFSGSAIGNYGPVNCAVEAPDEVACEFNGKLPSYEAIEVEILARLTGSPPAQGAPGNVTVSGGNAASASKVQTIQVTAEPTPFGVEQFSVEAEEEGGGRAAQAGGHPFQLTTTLQFNAGRTFPIPPEGLAKGARLIATEQPALPRTLQFLLPAGLVGNTKAVPRCDMATFLNRVDVKTLGNNCPSESVIGVASVTFVERAVLGLIRQRMPVFNLPPAPGEPARFGLVPGGAQVLIDTAVDPENEYRLIATIRNTPQIAEVLSSTVSFWGTPGDPRHDEARGWNCTDFSELTPCGPFDLSEDAFLRLPVQCSSPLDFAVIAEPWNIPLVDDVPFTSEPLHGCNRVPFNPSIEAAPTSKLAENPSGLSFRLDMPNSGLLNKEAIAEGQAKKIEVTLPEQMTINPSQGEGLAGCSPEEYARETVSSRAGEGCPEASKIGTVQIATPLLTEEARGSLYVASPHDNPFDSLVAFYMVAKIPERGVLIKQAGKVDPDPVTGQLTTTFDNLPQLPFSSFKLEFRPGGRAPLVTPPACGSYDVTARFTPWSAADPNNPAPDEIVTRTSTFQVERGVDGGACPGGGVPPFHPGLDAGTLNNAAGKYSPFNLRLTRKDGEQEFTNFSIKLPPGVVGKLAGIPFCSDAAIAAAKARTGPNGAQEELDSPSCPAASQIGHTLVGAGVGNSLTYVPGKVYLAGPHNGAPLSIVAITAVKVGPFDLGTVVVREALRINPETAEVFVDATNSDPIPHIIQGIPTHARDIRVYVDRPDFVLNPTSCERTSTASTVVGSGLDFGSDADNEPVTVTSPFQAASCASLGFKPRLQLNLRGKTKRGGNPALRAVLRPRAGDANAARISVALPHSEFLDQGHIRTVCTRVQFKAGAGNGAQCPRGSIYGRVRAWTPLLDEPLEGPIFLRSSENPLPDFVFALHGLIDLNSVMRVDSVNGGIRTTIDFVPDAPITKVVANFQGGKKGLLQNSTDICRGKHRAAVKMKGHNGRLHNFGAPLKAKCPKKKHAKRRSR